MQNKLEKKRFFGMDVRIINDEYVVLRDVYLALGRIDDGKVRSTDNRKLDELIELGIIRERESFTVTSKGKKQSREYQEISCILLSDVPLMLTQFKPTVRAGEEALKLWVDFMKFVNDILTTTEVHKYIITDKQRQLSHHELISELGGKPVIENQTVNEIMGILIGVGGRVKKEELRTYQNQTTIDLLDVREYVITKFETGYEVYESYSKAKEFALNKALKKYPFKMK